MADASHITRDFYPLRNLSTPRHCGYRSHIRLIISDTRLTRIPPATSKTSATPWRFHTSVRNISDKGDNFSACRNPLGLHGFTRQLLHQPSSESETDLEGLHGIDQDLCLEELHHTLPGSRGVRYVKSLLMQYFININISNIFFTILIFSKCVNILLISQKVEIYRVFPGIDFGPSFKNKTPPGSKRAPDTKQPSSNVGSKSPVKSFVEFLGGKRPNQIEKKTTSSPLSTVKSTSRRSYK